MPAFAFYLVSDEGEPSMRLVDVPDVDAAKTWAMDAIRSASLHTIRFWDGVRVIEVKRSAMRQPRQKPGDAEERGKRMIAIKAKGMKQREIAAAFGISIGRARDVMSREELRAREEAIQTNRATLSGRANNVHRARSGPCRARRATSRAGCSIDTPPNHECRQFGQSHSCRD